MKVSPTKVGAQVLRRQLRSCVQACMSASVHKNGAECWVQCSDFSPHATGFSQWLMTEIDEHRTYSAKILSAIRYSPIAAVLIEVGGCDNEACYLGCALRVES